MAFRAVLLFCAVAVISAASKHKKHTVSNDNLKAVVQIFRHGQRTPLSFYSTDPYGNLTIFWEGLSYGQLTNEGKRQHYALGQFTRSRYSGWLPTTYNSKDFHVQTTDVDRTHMSVQSNLFGLYPATGSQVWMKGITWQPIPVHPSDPRIVYFGSAGCSRLNTMMDAVFIEEDLATFNTTYASLYSYLSQYTGSPINSLFGAFDVYDALVVEDSKGYPLPSWTSEVYPEPLASLTTRVFLLYTQTTQLKRFTTGVFLNNLLAFFEEVGAGTSSSAKYQMYSAHDINVFNILDVLGNTPAEPLPFAVSLWFELRSVNGADVINLWMRSGKNFAQINISGCGLDCPVSKLKLLLSDVLLDIDTLDRECA